MAPLERNALKSDARVQTSAVGSPPAPKIGPPQFIAREEGKDRATIQRWIDQGCPVVRLGQVGRGRGALLDLHAVRRWRAERCVPGLARDTQADVLSIVEKALLDALKLDDLARRARVTDLHVLRIVLMIFERIYLNVKQERLTRAVLSKQMKQICANCIGSVARD